ncbi:MAG: hypothetical protein MZV49_27130 [Rhodopseudomonas palustris]|nr:hypothetical protein [Rhodopseudomonas palustris]
MPQPSLETAPAPKRGGQIAAFISGKDSRLYVRQEFAPLFDVPVEITASDRPLGTHVFTARLDKDNGNAISWSVLSMPQSARQADATDDSRTSRRRRRPPRPPTRSRPSRSPTARPRRLIGSRFQQRRWPGLPRNSPPALR